MLHKNFIFSQLFLLLLTIVIGNHVEGSSYLKISSEQPKDVFLNILSLNSLVGVSANFAQQSWLITTVQAIFPGAGAQENPIELILPKGVSTTIFNNFLEGKSGRPLIENELFLSLACYLGMPNVERTLEYCLSNSFRQLTLSNALSNAKMLQKLNVSLPPSFKHILLAKKLSALFVAANPVKLSVKNPVYLEVIRDKIETLADKIQAFYNNAKPSVELFFESFSSGIARVCTSGLTVALYELEDYNNANQKDNSSHNLFYFSQETSHPIALQHDNALDFYVMNNQADAIVVYDHEKKLIIWDKKEKNSFSEGIEWQKTIIDDTNTDYSKIIFNQEGNLFISLNKQKDLNIPQVGDVTNIKLWDSKNRIIIACHILELKGDECIDSINFFNNDTHVLLRINHTTFKIFAIASQSMIQEWHDYSMNADYSFCSYEIKKSSKEHYYISEHPLSLYNRYHQPLVKFDKNLLNVPTILDEDLTATFDSDDTLFLYDCLDEDDNFYIFDLPRLDTILRCIDKLSLLQAIALLFFSKSLYCQNNEQSDFRQLIDTLPQTIKELLGV